MIMSAQVLAQPLQNLHYSRSINYIPILRELTTPDIIYAHFSSTIVPAWLVVLIVNFTEAEGSKIK